MEFLFWTSPQRSNNNQVVLVHAERPTALRTAKFSYVHKSGQRGTLLFKSRGLGGIQAEANIGNSFLFRTDETNVIQIQQIRALRNAENEDFLDADRIQITCRIFLADSTTFTIVLCCVNSEDLNGVLPIFKTNFKLEEDLDLSVRELIQVFGRVTVDLPGKSSRWDKVFKIETGLELLSQSVFGSVILPGSKV